MSNINQYDFDELKDAEILISEDIFRRFVSITNLSGLFKEEHMCFLRGKEFKKNKIYFDELNENTDYVIGGSGSSNPYEHFVEPGENTRLSTEVEKWIENMNGKDVLCDVHTHPSGISQGIEYRKFSGADIESNKKFTLETKKNNITHIAGLISVDNEKGLSTISFIWYDDENDKFYRIPNISIVKLNEKNGNFDTIKKLPKYGNLEFIEMNFDQQYLEDDER